MKIPRYLVTGGIILLAVALALAVGYWNIRPASFTPQVIQDPLQPDFFMDNARIRQLNEQGQPVYDLVSVRAAHQVGDDVTELDDPKLLYYREGEQQPWDVQARYGEVSAGGDRVDLSQNVVIEQQLAGQPVRRLSTPALSIFPDRHFAETDRSVRIEAANGVTTATGMEANFNDGAIKLLSNVRGEHDAL
ncbi:MAG TPA: LPS export ABC transporter periplasmic protein LptC [Candidatus Pseudomonas excrementavium]|uniref:LPS export ABC transporter periplasmic protein LptC n=1 Tax=Halopseudomonas bauzanensis TaxID=653930 RepID=UPI001C39BF23|nr:LPS export ABC transporter periplasmic protein LptC [Halopseudomonas bauzanensis]HIZ49834.1 LPS export ABC transporter periplasmic protein LptC [Candidatus Pseudomonas excrementavium]